MIKWLRLYRPSTGSYLTVEMVSPVSTLDIAERWAQWRYPAWEVLNGSPIYIDGE